MSTVNQILRIADDLRSLIDRKRELDSALVGIQSKEDRLGAERQNVQAAIALKKDELRVAAAELE